MCIYIYRGVYAHTERDTERTSGESERERDRSRQRERERERQVGHPAAKLMVMAVAIFMALGSAFGKLLVCRLFSAFVANHI